MQVLDLGDDAQDVVHHVAPGVHVTRQPLRDAGAAAVEEERRGAARRELLRQGAVPAHVAIQPGQDQDRGTRAVARAGAELEGVALRRAHVEGPEVHPRGYSSVPGSSSILAAHISWLRTENSLSSLGRRTTVLDWNRRLPWSSLPRSCQPGCMTCSSGAASRWLLRLLWYSRFWLTSSRSTAPMKVRPCASESSPSGSTWKT